MVDRFREVDLKCQETGREFTVAFNLDLITKEKPFYLGCGVLSSREQISPKKGVMTITLTPMTRDEVKDNMLLVKGIPNEEGDVFVTIDCPRCDLKYRYFHEK